MQPDGSEEHFLRFRSLACLHNCPQHAIHMPLEAGTMQFRNEHVTLNDPIINELPLSMECEIVHTVAVGLRRI